MIGSSPLPSQVPDIRPRFNPDRIPLALGPDRHVWVAWGGFKPDKATGELKPDKAPRSPRAPFKPVSSTDPQWFTLEECVDAWRANPEQLFGVGRMLNAREDGIIGIDLDHVLEHGAGRELVDDLVRSMPHAYVERSPSGTGVRIMAWAPGAVAELLDAGVDHVTRRAWPCDGCAIEFYAYARGRRYLTITGDSIHPGDLTVDSSAQVLALVGRLKPSTAKRPPAPASTIEAKPLPTDSSQLTDAEIARAMLELVGDHRADDHEQWIRVGLACRGGGLGLEDWITFSMRCPAKFDRDECERRWATFKPTRADVSWLVAMAGEDAGEDRRREVLKALHAAKPTGPGWKHAKPEQRSMHQAGDGRSTRMLGADDPTTEFKCLEEFIEQHRGTWRHVTARGHWLEWRGGWWRYDVEGRIHALARDAVTGMFEAKGHTLNRMNAIVAAARAPMHLEAGELDVDGALVGVGPHGSERVLELRSGLVRPAKPEDRITRSTGILPGGEAPTWRRCLREWTCGDAELEQYLQLVAGYWLTGSVALHEFYLLHGEGGSGKGRFLDLTAAAMGPYAGGVNVAAILGGNETHPTSIAKLAGLRLAYSSELPKGSEWNESRVKALTGGDRRTGRFMHRDEFDYVPTDKLVISANVLPRIREGGEAWARRMRVIPFRAKLVRDTGLPARLYAELPGILTWMIDGAIRVLEIIDRGHTIPMPEAVRVASAGYLDAEDWFGQFIEDRCEVNATERWFTPTASIVAEFSEWSTSSGMAAHTSINARMLSAELPRRYGLEPEQLTTGDRARGWRGLRLRRAAEIPI